MTTVFVDRPTRTQLPAFWPAKLAPAELDAITAETPYLICDLDTVRARYAALTAAMPESSVFYAMKCNPSPAIVTALAAEGSSFEVASIGELDSLVELGIDPAGVLFSNPIKAPTAIARASALGLRRFSFDSEGELRKIAQNAPGAEVYVRLRVDDSTSVFPLSRKFGCDALDARALLLLARELGLRPYGLTFHVGSQCSSPTAWVQALAACSHLLRQLTRDGIVLEMLNMGGGFPAHYGEPIPDIAQIGRLIGTAIDEMLPYRPAVTAMEPGRHLVGDSAVLVSSVLGREMRAGENWLYLDVGAYNGLMETQQTVGQWRYPLWTSIRDHAESPRVPFTVTGPSCDSSDTMMYGVTLPDRIDTGDKVYIGSAGAYTLSYASTFNGFPIPSALFV